MKKSFLLLALAGMLAHGQDKMSFRSANGEISFRVSKKEIFVETNGKAKRIAEKALEKTDNFVLLDASNAYQSRFKSLQANYENVEPVLIYEDGIRQICFDEVIVKTKKKYLAQIFKGFTYTATENEFEKGQYLVRIQNTTTDKVFKLVSKFSGNRNVEYIEPNFIRLVAVSTNDPYFNSQWAIKNNTGAAGTVDADMDVDQAWTLATGTGIKVAVIDQGIDLTHPDLQANLLPGYDAYNGTTAGGYFGSYSSHGTPCAGIIAAVGNNGIGTAGIAYNAKVLPVRVGLGFLGSDGQNYIDTNDVKMANSVNWSWQNGADVLSNSWGGGSVSSALNAAINNAVTSGRGGKGCVVLFATGNSNTAVSYPASNPQVIAVGASNKYDERKSPQTVAHDECWGGFPDCPGGSNYGTNLDVMAPGVSVYTSDIQGSGGYNDGSSLYATSNYMHNFNGTSAACPNAAGVVALILSLKPTLNWAQVRQALEGTTDKVGPYSYLTNVSGQSNGTWNTQMGYGRVNAYKALQSIYDYKLYGNNPICSETTQAVVYLAPTPPAGTTYSWSVSPNLQILTNPANGAFIYVKSLAGNNTYQAGTITVTINGGPTITREVDLGNKPFSYGAAKTPVSVMAEYCDQTYHYLPVTVTTYNISPGVSYTYNFSEFNTGIANPGVTYTSLGSGQYLFKIPKNKIMSGSYPVITFNTTATGGCGVNTSIYGTAITITPCSGAIYGRTGESRLYTLYPNPSDSVINIGLRDEQITPMAGSAINAVLYNMLGREEGSVAIVGNKASIDVSSLAKGIYVLKIAVDGVIETHQVMVN